MQNQIHTTQKQPLPSIFNLILVHLCVLPVLYPRWLTLQKCTNMKTSKAIVLIFAIFAFSLAQTSHAQIVWQENFDGQLGKGITGGTPPVTNMTGITKWSIETSSSLASNQNFVVISNRTAGLVFEANNVRGEAVWHSETIDISTNGFVELTVDLSEVGTLIPSDYIRTYYSVDGQPETLFYENGDLNDDFISAIAKQEAVKGSNLVITIRTDNSTATKKHRFDNITVTDATPVSNQPPALAISPSGTSKSVVAGNLLSFDLTATEEYLDLADNITLKLAGITPSAPEAIFSTTNGTAPLSGTFSWTPETAGTYIAEFEASDKDGTNTLQVTIKVYPGKKTVWLEDFDDPTIDGKGAFGPSNTVDLTDITMWTVDVTNATLEDDKDYFKVTNSRFEGQDLDGESIWQSTNIDVSAYSSVSLSVDLGEEGDLFGTEYIRSYYTIDDGSEQLFSTNGDMTDDFDTATASTTNLTANSIQIIIRCRNIHGTHRHYFDNVKVSAPILNGMLMIVR